MILRLCFTYSLGRADAQDICQNVFLKLLQSDRRFDSEGETRAFIIRITINECKDVLKSGWRRRSVPLDELIEREVPFLPEENTGVLAAVQRLPRGMRRKKREDRRIHACFRAPSARASRRMPP